MSRKNPYLDSALMSWWRLSWRTVACLPIAAFFAQGQKEPVWLVVMMAAPVLIIPFVALLMRYVLRVSLAPRWPLLGILRFQFPLVGSYGVRRWLEDDHERSMDAAQRSARGW